MNEQERLQQTLDRFQQWADSTDSPARAKQSGEWELEYEHWSDIYESVRAVLRIPVGHWSANTKQLLIYAVARDNEGEIISEELTDEQLVVLADASLETDEWAAKWQFAARLGDKPTAEGGKQSLLAFTSDADEYVRRRSLMALAKTGSPQTEPLAVAAWGTGEEYQRMACLHALWCINSPMLTHYLELAKLDGRQYLTRLADRIRDKVGEYEEHQIKPDAFNG